MKLDRPKGGPVILKRRRIGDNGRVEEVPMPTDRDLVQVIREALRDDLGVLSWDFRAGSVLTARNSIHKSPRFGEPSILGVTRTGQPIAIWLPPGRDAIFRSELKRTQHQKILAAEGHSILCFTGDDPKVLIEEIAEAIA